jgi:hypothetical protein
MTIPFVVDLQRMLRGHHPTQNIYSTKNRPLIERSLNLEFHLSINQQLVTRVAPLGSPFFTLQNSIKILIAIFAAYILAPS